jgi:hypothetical protein
MEKVRESKAEKRIRKMHRNVITQKKIDLEHKRRRERERKERQRILQKKKLKEKEDYNPFDRFKSNDD